MRELDLINHMYGASATLVQESKELWQDGERVLSVDKINDLIHILLELRDHVEQY